MSQGGLEKKIHQILSKEKKCKPPRITVAFRKTIKTTLVELGFSDEEIKKILDSKNLKTEVVKVFTYTNEGRWFEQHAHNLLIVKIPRMLEIIKEKFPQVTINWEQIPQSPSEQEDCFGPLNIHYGLAFRKFPEEYLRDGDVPYYEHNHHKVYRARTSLSVFLEAFTSKKV